MATDFFASWGPRWLGRHDFRLDRTLPEPKTETNMKRTPKLTIIFRIGIIPFLVVSFWGLMFCIADPETGFYFVLGGVGTIFGAIGWCWGFTNVCTFLYSPRYYRLWKKGGGDPFFDTLDFPSTRILTKPAIKSFS